MKIKPHAVITFTMMLFDDCVKTHRTAFMINQITGEPVNASKEDILKLTFENPNAVEIMVGGTNAIEALLEESLGLKNEQK